MTAIWYDTDADRVVIEGALQTYAPRTLMTVADGDTIMVRLKVNTRNEFGPALYTTITDQAGNGFADMVSAVAYLNGVFAQKPEYRPLGQAYPLNGAASFSIAHGLSYAPTTTILDPNGFEVDTDVTHAPGRTILTFAFPFTGTLYLG